MTQRMGVQIWKDDWEATKARLAAAETLLSEALEKKEGWEGRARELLASDAGRI